MKKEEFLKNLSVSKWLLISGFITLIVSVLVFAVGIITTPVEEDAKNLLEVQKEGTFSRINVSIIDGYFATETVNGEERRYYLVYDKKYVYIACIDEENFSKLDKIYSYSYSSDETAVAPASVNIYGTAKEIPAEAMQYLQDWLVKEDGSKYTLSELKKYVGSFYLDTYDTGGDVVILCLAFGIILLIVGISLIVSYISRNRKSKKIFENQKDDIEKIAYELENGKAIYSKICKAYITEKFIVSYQARVKMIPVEDVVWIYPYEFRRNGAPVSKSVYVITKNGKTNILANTSAWGRKNRNAFEEFYQELINRMPKVLHGYSKENAEEAQALYERK